MCSFNEPEQLKGLSPQAFIVKRMLFIFAKYLEKSVLKINLTVWGTIIFLYAGMCAPRYKTFNYIKNAPLGKERLEQYIQDISDAISKNKLSDNNKYVL